METKRSTSVLNNNALQTPRRMHIGSIRSIFFTVVIVCTTLTVDKLKGFAFSDDATNTLPCIGRHGNNINDGRAFFDQGLPSRRSLNTHSPNQEVAQPKATTNSSLAIVVLSRRDSFSVRQTIRQTWAKKTDNVYFVVGKGCTIPIDLRGYDEGRNLICDYAHDPLPLNYKNLTKTQIKLEKEVDERLQNEQYTYRDMVLSQEFIDVYRSLPKKLKAAYKFVYENLPQHIHWVLKVDDDFFVRPKAYEQFLLSKYSRKQAPVPPPPVVMGGNIVYNHTPFTTGKWKEVPQYPNSTEYPPYPVGSRGHAVSRPVFKYVVENSDLLFDYQGEDVSLGIWLADTKIGNSPITFVDASKQMKNDQECLDPHHLVVGHDLTEYDIKWCHKHRNSKPKDRVALLATKYDTNQ